MTTKVAITIDQDLLAQLDELVTARVFPGRSKAFQQAVQEKLERRRGSRLAEEFARLDPQVEQAFAEEEMTWELQVSPEYREATLFGPISTRRAVTSMQGCARFWSLAMISSMSAQEL